MKGNLVKVKTNGYEIILYVENNRIKRFITDDLYGGEMDVEDVEDVSDWEEVKENQLLDDYLFEMDGEIIQSCDF